MAQINAQLKAADDQVAEFGNDAWGKIVQSNRDLVKIQDFTIGEDTIRLPGIADHSSYQYQAVIGSGGTFIRVKMGTNNPTDVLFIENTYRGIEDGLDDAQFTALIADLLNPKSGMIGVFKNTPLQNFGSIVSGTFANDQIIGKNTAETAVGHYGDDVILGKGGNDTLYGGTKSTRGQSFNLVIAARYAHDGNDILSGGDGPVAMATISSMAKPETIIW